MKTNYKKKLYIKIHPKTPVIYENEIQKIYTHNP